MLNTGTLLLCTLVEHRDSHLLPYQAYNLPLELTGAHKQPNPVVLSNWICHIRQRWSKKVGKYAPLSYFFGENDASFQTHSTEDYFCIYVIDVPF